METADLSARFAEIVAGERRAARVPTLLIAGLVTALVAIPLLVRAGDADDPAAPAVASAEITVDLASGDPVPLDGATLSGSALISVRDDGARAASFSLFAAGADEPLLAGQDLDGPIFSPVLSDQGAERPLDTRALANGRYDLFVVMTTDSGEARSAASFEVANP